MPTRYYHRPGYSTFDKEVLCSPGLTAHIDAIMDEAGRIAHATAPEQTGEFKGSFVVGTAVEDHAGRRVVGFLASVDPDAVAKEFANPDDTENHTMNKAVRKAIG